jgi:opacity protein-like surface antigen
MRIRTAVLLALATLAPMGAARAQVSNPLKFTIFGGAALPSGDTQDGVKTGYIVGGAVDFRVPLMPLGFRGELGYASFDAKESAGLSDADMSDLGVNANAVFWLPSGPSPIRPYFTGGLSYSRIKLSGEESGIEASIDDNGFGFNFGGGVDFALGTLSTRLDARYKRVSIDFGDTGEDSKVTYIPITFGLTF